MVDFRAQRWCPAPALTGKSKSFISPFNVSEPWISLIPLCVALFFTWLTIQTAWTRIWIDWLWIITVPFATQRLSYNCRLQRSWPIASAQSSSCPKRRRARLRELASPQRFCLKVFQLFSEPTFCFFMCLLLQQLNKRHWYTLIGACSHLHGKDTEAMPHTAASFQDPCHPPGDFLPVQQRVHKSLSWILNPTSCRFLESGAK